MVSTNYEDNWRHYNALEKQAEQARNQYEAARSAHASAEVGSIERVQLQSVAQQKQVDAQTAENAFNAFKQEVQQSQPEQMKYLEMGVAPNATRMVDTVEVAMAAAPVIAEEVVPMAVEKVLPVDFDFLNGSGISVMEVAKESVEAIKNTPDYVAGMRTARADEQIAQAPPESLGSRADNAITDEIQKTDRAAFKQRELDKLQLQHSEQTAKQEAQLEKFAQSQADKPAEVQAKQAELAEKARAELAEKQEREMKEKIAELERSRAEALEAQARAKALEDERNKGGK